MCVNVSLCVHMCVFECVYVSMCVHVSVDVDVDGVDVNVNSIQSSMSDAASGWIFLISLSSWQQGLLLP